jgi:hypothetical protein
LMHPDPIFRAGMRRYSSIGRRVWPYEIVQWLFCDCRTRHGPTLAEFLKGAWATRRNRSPDPALDGSQAGSDYRGHPLNPKIICTFDS